MDLYVHSQHYLIAGIYRPPNQLDFMTSSIFAPYNSIFIIHLFGTAHARKVETALNETCRIITGCIWSTKVQQLYLIASIPPPDIRCTVQSQFEKFKKENDTRHPLHGHLAARTNQWLESRKPFLGRTKAINTDIHYALLDYWQENWNESRALADVGIQPSLNTIGRELSWAQWRIFNQLRVRKMPTRYDLKRWRYAENEECHRCGAPCDNFEHTMTCGGINCTNQNLRTLDEIANDDNQTTDGPRLIRPEQDKLRNILELIQVPSF